MSFLLLKDVQTVACSTRVCRTSIHLSKALSALRNRPFGFLAVQPRQPLNSKRVLTVAVETGLLLISINPVVIGGTVKCGLH